MTSSRRTCAFCEKRLRNEDELADHLAAEHGFDRFEPSEPEAQVPAEPAPIIDPERPFRCSRCPRAFRSLDALHEHRYASHGMPKPDPSGGKIPMIQPVCIECGKMASLVDGGEIYPHRPDLKHKLYYKCSCGAYCGCHPGTTIALGYPCGPETRAARQEAHKVFDTLWQNGWHTRHSAYQWLAKRMKLSAERCHIGQMTAEQARQVTEFVLRETEGEPTFVPASALADGLKRLQDADVVFSITPAQSQEIHSHE